MAIARERERDLELLIPVSTTTILSETKLLSPPSVASSNHSSPGKEVPEFDSFIHLI